MVSASKCGPQDMPPSGGYNPIQWNRIKLKTIFRSTMPIGIFVACAIIGNFAFSSTVLYHTYKRYDNERLEEANIRFALLPMITAERDRMFLKQVRKNRDIERELMKNVPEWKVGTYFGEPVFRTMVDKFIEPTFGEFHVHVNNDWTLNRFHGLDSV